ncbi:MAG: autotransporter domain-containing protein, partial [Alphaproteobacteria bacterium]|nr:autotransporter domain-containing protein [Alphaproteobacteria bacterium]
NITGTGSLDVTIGGGGTLTLTGTTDYTGATTVGGSTILALNSTNALTGTSHITFTNAAADFTSAMNGQTFDRDITIAGTQDTINIDSGTTVTLSGTIDGAGQFVKAGAGHLILTGTKTYAGGTDVTNGLLSVNTTITGATTVGGGGSIGGTGTTGDLTIDNNGTLAPGNSIGTFNVAGNLIFNSNASYDVEADENGNADKTVATGAITINGGTVNANAASGIYRPVTTYTILQGASVTGAFDNVTDNLAFLDPSLVYNPDSVQLVLTRNNNPFESAATNGQQAGIAAAVEGLDLGNDLYDAVVVLPVQDARHAFDALSGGQTAAVSGALGAGMSRLRGVLGYHLANLTLMGSSGSVASAAPAADDADPGSYVAAYLEPSDGHDTTGRNIWIQGIGSFGATTDRGTTPSSARHSAGAIAGIDMPFEDDGYYGIYAGWESGGVKTNALHSSSNIDSYHLGAYATHSLPHGLNLAGGLSAAWHDISSRRVIEFTGWNTRATGDTNGQTYMAFAELSRDYDVGGDIAFAPFADVSVIHNRIAGFAETGGGTANLTVQDTHATTPSHTLGLRLGHLGGAGAARYKIGAKLGWMHNYGALADKTTQRFSTGTVSFSDLGPARDRDAAVLGLDFNVYMDAALTAYLGYDGTYSTNSRDTSLSAGVKIRF